MVAVNLLYCIFSSRKVDMGDNPEQQFVWALKNGDMDQVKSIVGKVFVMPAQRYYTAGMKSVPASLARRSGAARICR